MNRGIKMKYVKKIFLIGAAGLTFFALSACDDSSSAGGDETETSALSCSAEMSSASRHCEDCKDEAISSSGKSNDPAEATDKSSDSKDNPSSAGTSTKSSNSNSSGTTTKSSNSSAKSSSSVYGSGQCEVETDENCFKDARDGQTYKMVKIGDQVWMAQNLNYQAENSWCGGGRHQTMEEGDCAIYGRLYTWAAAMGKSEDECGCYHDCTTLGTGNVQGVCPNGWHVPAQSEWEELFGAVGDATWATAGLKLKTKTGWIGEESNGTDDYGFSALPAGIAYYEGYFARVGRNAYFWSASQFSKDYAYYAYLYFLKSAWLYHDYSKDHGFSVRCVKDSE